QAIQTQAYRTTTDSHRNPDIFNNSKLPKLNVTRAIAPLAYAKGPHALQPKDHLAISSLSDKTQAILAMNDDVLPVVSGPDKNGVAWFGVIDRALDFLIGAGSVLGHNNRRGSRRGFRRERDRGPKHERSAR